MVVVMIIARCNITEPEGKGSNVKVLLGTLFTVKLPKPLTPEIFMDVIVLHRKSQSYFLCSWI